VTSPAVFLRLMIRLTKRSVHGAAYSPLWVGIVSVDHLGSGRTLARAPVSHPELMEA